MVLGMHIMEHGQLILSNDSYHIEYFYVDRNVNEGIFVMRISLLLSSDSAFHGEATI